MELRQAGKSQAGYFFEYLRTRYHRSNVSVHSERGSYIRSTQLYRLRDTDNDTARQGAEKSKPLRRVYIQPDAVYTAQTYPQPLHRYRRNAFHNNPERGIQYRRIHSIGFSAPRLLVGRLFPDIPMAVSVLRRVFL